MPAPTVTAASPAIHPAAGGTTITLTGTNFTGTTGVTIGGVAATSVTVVSSTSITCTVPAGTAGAASILVTNGSGTNGANTLAYYVAATPSDIYVYLSGGRGDGHVPNWTGVVTDVAETEAGQPYRDIFPSSRMGFAAGLNVDAKDAYWDEGATAFGNAAGTKGRLSDEVSHTAPRGWTKTVTYSHFLSSDGKSYKFQKSLIIGVGDEPRSE